MKLESYTDEEIKIIDNTAYDKAVKEDLAGGELKEWNFIFAKQILKVSHELLKDYYIVSKTKVCEVLATFTTGYPGPSANAKDIKAAFLQLGFDLEPTQEEKDIQFIRDQINMFVSPATNPDAKILNKNDLEMVMKTIIKYAREEKK